MASIVPRRLLSFALSLLLILPLGTYADAPLVTHHGGRMLTGNVDIAIMWYGPIDPVQRDAILNFLQSLNGISEIQPQVSSWWQIVEGYQAFCRTPIPGNPKINVRVVSQKEDPNWSQGKVLVKDFIAAMMPETTGGKPDVLALFVASKGVRIQHMSAGPCGQHGFIDGQPYIAVGNPEEECPECSWPFAQIASPLKPVTGNVGADALVLMVAAGLADAVTNPFEDGFYGPAPKDGIFEASTACQGILASGAAPPENPGKVLIDPTNGGAFNANGVAQTKFLLPAIWNPATSSCWTPV